jgi:hypothetical protein
LTDYLVTIRVSAIDAIEAASEVRSAPCRGDHAGATVVAVEED